MPFTLSFSDSTHCGNEANFFPGLPSLQQGNPCIPTMYNDKLKASDVLNKSINISTSINK